MLNAAEAAARYEPRPTDTPKALFETRLQICETCPSRQGQSCLRSTFPSPVCTVLARSPDMRCPERRWPGDPPRIDIRIPLESPGWLSRLRSKFRRPQPTEAARDRVWAKRSTSVSIVIAGRNYGRFLHEAIESALKQSPPCEVIYSDDASQDDSLAVARRYADRGLIVLEHAVHQGPAAARARGIAVARGDWFITLDADDVLPPHYVTAMLAVADPDTPYVYGDAQAFGESSHLWAAAWWDDPQTSLWVCNYVHTSAMYSRAAYHAAGGWQDGIGTMWDWDLALRALRFGRPQRQQKVPLLYRQHAASFSHLYHEHDESVAACAREKVRRRLARLSVGSILSGRLPGKFAEWLDALARSVRQLRSPWPVDLVLLYHQAAVQSLTFRDVIARECARHAGTFDTIRVLPHGHALIYATEQGRRDRVAEFLAASCNRLRRELRGDLHWIVEDDILVPLDGAEKLFTAITSTACPPEAVSGLYRNRHVPDRIVGGWWRDKEAHEPTFNQATNSQHPLLIVDLCGTGCLMYWRDRVPEWESHFEKIPAHDWAWSMEIKRRGGRVWLLPEVPCGHMVDETTTLTARALQFQSSPGS